MTINIETSYNIYQILSDFIDKKMAVKLSYKIMKNLDSLEKEMDFYKKKLQELIDEYAVKDENNNIVFSNNGQDIKIQEDKIQDFNKKHQELLKMEIDFNSYPFTLEELETLQLSPKELYMLQPIIEE